MRSSSSLPSTAASGRRSRITEKALGTSVKTSRRTTRNRSRQLDEAGIEKRRDRSTIDLAHAVLDERQQQTACRARARRSRALGRTSRTTPTRTPALVDHVEPDEVGDVVAVGRELGEAASRGTRQLGTARDRAVELDCAAPAADLPRQHDDRAGSPSTSSSAPTSNRLGSSLASSTTNAPSSPCGRPTRPTRTRSCSGQSAISST